MYDENDVFIQDMPFGEAMNEAKIMKKDIVLRNAKTDPPIVKITNYRKDLLKKLFNKLGGSAAAKS